MMALGDRDHQRDERRDQHAEHRECDLDQHAEHRKCDLDQHVAQRRRQHAHTGRRHTWDYRWTVAMARRDDSNRFVVSVNMFNRTTPDGWILVAILVTMAIYWYWVSRLARKSLT